MVGQNLTELTFFYERCRAVSAGILETAGSTFLLLIAVRELNAGAVAKALVAGGGSLGLLCTPWVVALVGVRGWTASQAASRLAVMGAASLVMMALAPALPVFVIGSVLAMAAASSAVPLMTQMYQDNYPEQARGRLFSKTVMIRIAIAAIFSEVAGRVFSDRLHHFRWLLLICAGAFAFSSFCLRRCPSRPLAVASGIPLFRAWRCVGEDRLFRHTLVCWMLMGFANLMMYPMRVEYLANPKYKMALSVSMIALYVGVIPNIARLILSPIWGWLFDHMNFFALRVILNAGFALGILTFFTSQSSTGLLIGAIVFGMSNAGGDVAWSLWVTKFAPPERVADYMAVHTFFTGLRGVAAPLVAFHLAGSISMITMGWISAGLICLASVLLAPEIRFGPVARPAAALVEEVSE
jgi:MFS family permease